MTVNDVDPDMLSRINAGIVWHGRIYTGREASEILIENQLKGIEKVAKGWGWPALSAALSIALAVVILCRPFSTTVAIWRFTGITLIVEAVVDVLTVLIGKKNHIA